MNNNQNTDEEIEIDLLELFFEFLKHWKSIVASTILAGAIAFAISYFFITPLYTSTSELYVLSKSTSITSLTDIQMGTSLTNDYLVVVTGRPVIEKVIDNLGLEEDTYETLYNRIDVENPSNSRILEITVTDADPSKAKLIADEIAEVSASFISEKMDQDPPSIIQHGYVAEDPVSPNKAKNAVIGALVGMLIAMLIVFAGYMLDDTLLTPDDVEKKLGLTVLGSLPLEEETEFDGSKGETKTKSKKKEA